MKTRIILLAASALLFGACTTGSYLTSSYSDDIYFNPGDVPPPVVAEKVSPPEEQPEKQPSDEKLIISQIRKNEDGSKTMNNYIYNNKEGQKDAEVLLYNMEQQQPDQSDTTVLYNDDDIKYVINNYYEGDDLDYTYRIRRFHRPFFYDPFYWDSWAYDPWYWDSWYSPYWSWSWNWGWGSWYSPYSWYGGFGWYSPWYYGGWYSPYYSWYYPYSMWYSPYYSWYSPYYSGYWGHGLYVDSENYRYGKRRTENTNVVRGSGGSGRMGSVGPGREFAGNKSASENQVVNDVNSGQESRRANSISGVDGSSHPRAGTEINNTLDKSANTGANVLSERRRNYNTPTSNLNRYNNTTINRGYTNSQNTDNADAARRNNSFGSGYSGTTRVIDRNDYQPSYNQMKSASRTSSYNRESYTRPSTSSYSQPRVINNNSGSAGSTPRSSSSIGNTYRSSSTYNRSSSSGSVGRSSYSSSGGYSSPSRSSYSAPSGGYSAPSGGGYSAPSGGGGYSGGSSGGSSSHSSGVSNSGRR